MHKVSAGFGMRDMRSCLGRTKKINKWRSCEFFLPSLPPKFLQGLLGLPEWEGTTGGGLVEHLAEVSMTRYTLRTTHEEPGNK